MKKDLKDLEKIGNDCTIVIDANVTPRIHPPRKIPLALREPLIKEIKQLENDGII